MEQLSTYVVCSNMKVKSSKIKRYSEYAVSKHERKNERDAVPGDRY